MKKIILTSLVFFLLATAASAEDMKFYAGANLRQVNAMFNDMDNFNNSLFVGLQKDNLRFEAYPIITYGKYESGPFDVTETFFGLCGSFFYDFAPSGIITPFVGLSASFGRGTEKTEFDGTKVGDVKFSGYTLGAMGGISLSFSKSWNFDIIAGLNYNNSEDLGFKGYSFDLVGMRIRYTF